MSHTVERILLTHLQVILDRLERDPRYGFVDTKFSTIDGRDFADEDAVRGKNAVYGWIQARALEALSEHGRWLQRSVQIPDSQREELLQRVRRALPGLVQRVLQVQAGSGGHLPFVFRPDGTPLAVDSTGSLNPAPPPTTSTYGDLFLAKGLLAAGAFLAQPELRDKGLVLLSGVLEDIETNRFRSNQQPLRPPYRNTWASAHQEEGPWMLALGALDLAFRETGNSKWLVKAASFIQRLVQRHLNRGQFDELEPLDFVETVTEDGRPLVRSGQVICVPGHALEFVGLSAKVLLTARALPQVPESSNRILAETGDLLPGLFLHIFNLGYRPDVGGIVASVDLLSRGTANSSFPWWAVTEALRAAALVRQVAVDSPADEQLLKAQGHLLDDLLNRWINPRAHFWLFQTRDRTGKPVDLIPATPDADPGYHTGLSLLDFLETQNSEV